MFHFNINMYAVYEGLNLLLTFNLGTDETVQGFFTSIAYHLENKKWGSVYPIIMNKFYSGKLEQKDINNAIKEIKEIKQRLSEIDFSQMVFSMESVPEKKYLKEEEKITISLDDIFINNNREKMTDMILTVLESVKESKIPLYIGTYNYKELYDKKLSNTIERTKKKQKRNTIIKYIIYLLIVLIVKFTVTEQQFNGFIMKFIFSMIVAELLIYNRKKKIDNKVKESEKQQEIEYKYYAEPITLERNLMSSPFDRILDEIDCPRTFNDILTTLKAKKIENWQADIEKIHSDLGYSSEYIEIIIENFEHSREEFDTFEYYQIENIYKVIPKEKIEKFYDENDIYRIIKYDNHINLIVFNNLKK